MFYLWSTRSAKDVAVIVWVPLDRAPFLKGLDLIQAKRCVVVSRVEAEGELVDLAGVVLFDDTTQAQVPKDGFELLGLRCCC